MSAGKWDVFKSLAGTWAAYQVGNLRIPIRHFDTHAEALAYAIEQAEAER